MARLTRALPALATALVVLLPAPASAHISRPVGPYTLTTADQRFIFVMACSCRYGDGCPEPIDGYTQSGLYRNDGSKTPLWTVDWCDSVLLPSDGVHLVRSPGATTLYGGEAVSFFSRGRLLRTYTASELMDFTWFLPESSAGLAWRRSIELEGGKTVYPLVTRGGKPERPAPSIPSRHATHIRIETVHGDRFVFLLETGEMVSSHRPLRRVATGLAAVLALAWIGYVVAASRMRRRSSGTRVLRCLHRSLAFGWALAAVPLSGALVLIGLGFATGHGFRQPLAESLWRFFVRVPYLRTTLLLGRMPQMQMSLPDLLLVWGIWTVVAALLLTGTALAVRAIATLRGRPLEPEGYRPGPVPLARQIVVLVGVGALSFVLLDGAGMAAPGPSIVLASVAVVGPAILLLRQRRARRA